MYAQIGNIKFEALAGFSSFQRTSGAKYVEMPLLDGKARLQRTGSDLEQITFGMYLDRAFTNPAAQIALISDHIENGDVLGFTTGTGEYLGKFVFVSMAQTHTKTTTTGEIIGVSLAVVLKEFVDPNPESTKLNEQQSIAFAIDANKIVPINLVRVGTTVQAITSLKVQAVSSNSIGAVSLIEKVGDVPTQQPGLFLRAKFLLNQTIDNATSVIENIQQSVSLAAVVPSLLNAVENVKSNAEFVKNRVDAGDLTNSLSGSLILIDSLGLMDDAVRPLDSLIIARKKI